MEDILATDIMAEKLKKLYKIINLSISFNYYGLVRWIYKTLTCWDCTAENSAV